MTEMRWPISFSFECHASDDWKIFTTGCAKNFESSNRELTDKSRELNTNYCCNDLRHNLRSNSDNTNFSSMTV